MNTEDALAMIGMGDTQKEKKNAQEDSKGKKRERRDGKRKRRGSVASRSNSMSVRGGGWCDFDRFRIAVVAWVCC